MKQSWEIYLFKISGLIFMLDIMFTGSGAWSYILGISVRKICFIVLCISSLFIWVKIKRVNKMEVYAISFVAGFLFLWVFIIPQVKNIPLHNSILDSQSLFGLIFFPAIANAVIYTSNWQEFKKLIYFSSMLLAIIHVVLGLIEMAFPEFGPKIIELARFVLEPMNLEDDASTSVYIGYVDEKFRVFWGSTVLLLIGYYFLIKSVFSSNKKIIISIFFLFGAALYFTQTRGLLIGIIVMFVLILLNHYFLYRIIFNLYTLFFLGIVLTLITIPIIFLSDPSLLASIGLGRDISDDLRFDQVRPLLEAFFDNFIWGKGFGASVDLIRSEDMPWSYELSILALYMKCGIFGIFSLILCFVLYGQTEAINNIPSNVRIELFDLYALLFALIFASNTNPYLFNFIGFTMLLFVYIEYRYILVSARNAS